MSEDPLKTLFVDSAELDRAAIAQALKGIIGIDPKTREVVPQAGIEPLGARQRILAYLLGCKVAQLLEVVETDGVMPGQVTSAIGTPPGTARPKLRELLETRMVSQDAEGKYYLAHHQVTGAIAELQVPRKRDSVTKRGTKKRTGTKKPGAQPARAAEAEESTKAPVERGRGAQGKTASKKAGSKKTVRSSGVAAEFNRLVEQGFFNTPKTLKEVEQHLRKRRGITTDQPHLSPIALRLLRRGVLDRDENDGGVYEYVARGGG